MTYTEEQLLNLKAAYASGVLRVRNNDEWVEYNSMSQLRTAIRDIEDELANAARMSRPRGAYVASISKGFK